MLPTSMIRPAGSRRRPVGRTTGPAAVPSRSGSREPQATRKASTSDRVDRNGALRIEGRSLFRLGKHLIMNRALVEGEQHRPGSRRHDGTLPARTGEVLDGIPRVEEGDGDELDLV